MNIRDISEVTWSITRLDITARSEDTKYLHRWIIGEKMPYIKPGSRMYWDEREGKISFVEKKINIHNSRKANGQPEIGWGIDESALPAELMDAKITTLSMNCANGIEYEVTISVILPPLLVDMLKQQLKPFEV